MKLVTIHWHNPRDLWRVFDLYTEELHGEFKTEEEADEYKERTQNKLMERKETK